MDKLKEIMIDFRRDKPPASPVCITGVNVVSKYKYLNIKLEWSTHIDAVYKNGLLPKAALILQSMQQDASDLLPVCCGDYRYPCCGVIG